MLTFFPPAFVRCSFIAAVLMACGRAWGSQLTLHDERSSAFDLEIRGTLGAVGPGSSRFLRWTDLRQLKSQELKLIGEFIPGEQTVTVVFLSDVLKELPLQSGTDVVVASCSDGYVSVFDAAFISSYRPFLILEINGAGPEKWPPRGLSFNPGPYVVSFAPSLVPDQPAVLDPGHKRPWGVVRLEFAHFADRFSAAYTVKWADLSARAQQGREIWINSCACCHSGPAGMLGGTKSDRPFQVLAAYAEFNVAYFKRYVREPQTVNVAAKMEGHPHYTDAQLDALIAFILAEPPSK